MPKTTNQKQHIVQCALKLFATRGYSNTSTRLIASTAKVSLGLLYNYFKNKEDLLKEIVDQGFADIKTSMKIYSDKSVTPQQMIEIHVTRTFEIIQQHNSFWRLAHTIRLQDKVLDNSKKAFAEVVRHVTSVFTSVFRKLGYAKPELEAVLFLSQIDGLAILFLQDPTIEIKKLSRQLIQRYKK